MAFNPVLSQKHRHESEQSGEWMELEEEKREEERGGGAPKINNREGRRTQEREEKT